MDAKRRQDYIYGSLEGVAVGTRAVSLFELRKLGIHNSSRNKHFNKKGMFSVIVSDKDSDDGELVIIISDAKSNNKTKGTQIKTAVFQNYINNIPIRVVRCDKVGGQFSPIYGYRYDGLYVVDFMGEETISIGLKRMYFHLHRLPNQPVMWERAPMLLQILPFPRTVKGRTRA